MAYIIMLIDSFQVVGVAWYWWRKRGCRLARLGTSLLIRYFGGLLEDREQELKNLCVMNTGSNYFSIVLFREFESVVRSILHKSTKLLCQAEN